VLRADVIVDLMLSEYRRFRIHGPSLTREPPQGAVLVNSLNSWNDQRRLSSREPLTPACAGR
jgi:hypothetical protein